MAQETTFIILYELIMKKNPQNTHIYITESRRCYIPETNTINQLYCNLKS